MLYSGPNHHVNVQGSLSPVRSGLFKILVLSPAFLTPQVRNRSVLKVGVDVEETDAWGMDAYSRWVRYGVVGWWVRYGVVGWWVQLSSEGRPL